MAVTVTVAYSPDEVSSFLADGWTHIRLYIANSHDLEYTYTLNQLQLVPTQTTYVFNYSAGNPSQWAKVLLYSSTTNTTQDISMARPFHLGGGTTYSDLRRLVGMPMKCLIQGTTSAAGTASTFVVNSPQFLVYPNGHLIGWYVYFPSLNHWGVVSDWNQTSGVATFYPAYGSAIGAGVSVVLTRRWNNDEFRDAINWAISSAYPMLSYRSVKELAVSAQQTSVQIPNDMVSVLSVEKRIETQAGAVLYNAVPYSVQGDGLSKYVVFPKSFGEDSIIRVTGIGPLQSVYSDSDYVEAVAPHVMLIVYLAQHRLWSMLPNDAASSDVERYKEQANYYYNMYEQLKNRFFAGRSGTIWGSAVYPGFRPRT
jgi:hypothetical protein